MAKKINLKTAPSRMQLSGFIFSVLLVFAMVVPTGFLVETAGPAINVNSSDKAQQLVAISGVNTFPSDTQLLMTTVSVYGNADNGVSGAKAISALIKNDKQLMPIRAIYPPGMNAKQTEKRNRELMAQSQSSASLLAFEMAGYKPSMDIIIAQTSKDNPSGKFLRKGDVIKGIKLKANDPYYVPKTYAKLTAALDLIPPKNKIFVKVLRNGKEKEFSFTTVPYVADATGWVHPGSLMGVAIELKNVKLPGKVNYLVQNIGGPSAGNMFAIAIYDKLTQGSLGGGHVIGGTGTVAWDGDVGPIGGITHKMQGAAKQGARDFLAPAENCGEVVGNEPAGMRVWAVRTTRESIKAVSAIAKGDTGKLKTCEQVIKAQK